MTRSIVINILLPICFLFFIADVEAKVKVRTNDGELVSIEQLADSSVVDSVPQNKAKVFFKKVGVFADNWFMRGADTNYIALPKYRFRLAINSEAGSVHTILSSEHIPYYENINCRFNSNLTPKLGLVLGFRNLQAGYSVDLFKGYSNFSLSLCQNAFGLEILRRKTFYANGYIDASSIEGRTNINAGDIGVTTFFLSAYFAFNRKRFSMPAAFNQSYIQRKSAGSVLAYVDFLYTDMMFAEKSYMAMTGGLHSFELYQVALGVGYGYNYTPNKGKVLLHISAAPLLVFFNRMFQTGDTRMITDEKTMGFNLIFSRKIKPAFPVYLTGIVKAAVVWNINDRFSVAASAVCNNIRFRSHDTLYEADKKIDEKYNPYIDMSLMTWDWKMNVYLTVRF